MPLPSDPHPSSAAVERALRRWSFARLAPSRASRGPLVAQPWIDAHANVGPDVLTLALVPREAGPRAEAAFLAAIEWGGFGSKIDLDGHMATLSALKELRFVLEPSEPNFQARLLAAGFVGRDGVWSAVDAEWRIPRGGPEWGGEVHPCMGYLGDIGSPPGAMRHVRGFYVAALPPGVTADHSSRGYHFVHDIETRSVERTRVIVALPAGCSDLSARIERGLARLFSGDDAS